jgi:hypothetical protein
MAKCKDCGKGGFFFKVNSEGLCKECERISILKAKELKLLSDIKDMDAACAKCNNEYLEIKNSKDELYRNMFEQAKKDALLIISEQIENQNKTLLALVKKTEEQKAALDAVTDEYSQSQKTIATNANKLRKLQTLYKSMQYSVKKYYDEDTLSKGMLSESDSSESEELLSTTIKLKLHLMDIRELRKLYNQNYRIIKDLLVKYQDRYTTKANATIYKLMVIALEAELQNVLYNLKYSKLDKAIFDIKIITAKYLKIATDGNQNIAPTMNKFIGEIEYLFIEAIKIEYEYYIQKERIREEQKAIRERIRQEAAERKLLEEERKKIEQEELKFHNEIDNAKAQLANTTDEIKRQQLEERIAKVQEQLASVEMKKDEIIKLQKGKAGHIYVISNLGSFGDNVFKIGMTRRLDPQERIDELGDASVPFRYDVHSIIFSENAPGLEYKLHKHLNDRRINKINLRKEFFNTSIDELENLVSSLEPSAEFNKTMLAEQYYQSMAVEEVPDEVQIIDEELSDKDEEDEQVS